MSDITDLGFFDSSLMSLMLIALIGARNRGTP
jgi:hypothetical protein